MDAFETAARAEAASWIGMDLDDHDNFVSGAEWARTHLAAQEPTDAEVEAAAHALHEDMGGMPDEFESMHIEAARAALTAARSVGRNAR